MDLETLNRIRSKEGESPGHSQIIAGSHIKPKIIVKPYFDSSREELKTENGSVKQQINFWERKRELSSDRIKYKMSKTYGKNKVLKRKPKTYKSGMYIYPDYNLRFHQIDKKHLHFTESSSSSSSFMNESFTKYPSLEEQSRKDNPSKNITENKIINDATPCLLQNRKAKKNYTQRKFIIEDDEQTKISKKRMVSPLSPLINRYEILGNHTSIMKGNVQPQKIFRHKEVKERNQSSENSSFDKISGISYIMYDEADKKGEGSSEDKTITLVDNSINLKKFNAEKSSAMIDGTYTLEYNGTKKETEILQPMFIQTIQQIQCLWEEILEFIKENSKETVTILFILRFLMIISLFALYIQTK